MTQRTDPARPAVPVLPDGRLLREVTSYARRGSRLSPRQQSAWDEHARRWLIPTGVVADEGLDQRRWFGREAPLVVEVGSGVGESLAGLAGPRAAYDLLGLEVWRPGVARTFERLERAGATNVRLLMVDAVWFLEHAVGPGEVTELWTFFPDPWHKKRHHKRRLVSPEFAALTASRLAVGGLWRLATDSDEYAEQIGAVLDAEPSLAGGVVPRWEERPVTKFERRGTEAGRSVTDLAYRRR